MNTDLSFFLVQTLKTFYGNLTRIMALQYKALEYGFFREQLLSLPHDVQVAMSKEVLKLEANPFRKGTKRLQDDLDGILRIHVGRINNILYCIAYVVCEDCKKRGFEEKFNCYDCYKRHWYHIKLLSCGLRDGFYDELSKNWATWMQTVEWKNISTSQE